jgi:hypothetical protein
MALRDLSLSDWADMGDEMARGECEAIAQALPHGATFNGLKAHAYCGREYRIARFRLGDGEEAAEFVLVPGGEASVGFDGRDFRPSEQQLESFARSAEEYCIDQSIREFVDAQTSAPRVVYVAAMLVEVEARDIGVEQVGLDDPTYGELCRQLRGKGPTRTEYAGGHLDGCYVIERSADGTCRAWRRRLTTSAEVETALAAQGMRLPTCDEWERACGAGATTLFRWGDDTPADFYPGEASAEDRQQRTAWALSGGRLPYSRPPAVWDIHERPNLFGLRIAMNPYHVDLVADGPHALGGDGGCNICGGAGFFLGWLPLATAFREPSAGSWSAPDANVADGYCRVRRVISIP